MKMKINSRILAFLFIALSALPSMASAETYYADININVMENGNAVIEGISNHPMLLPGTYPDYTSKEKTVWTLNISPSGIFSEYLVEISFPPDAEVKYLKLPSILSIREEAGSVIVTSSGSDSELFILAQYQIKSSRETADYFTLIAAALLTASVLLVVYWLFFLRKPSGKENATNLHYNPDALTERQKQIMDIVVRNNGSITQSQLQKLTCLPKASLSRNVDGLIRKGILTKEEKGMTNLICMRKEKA